MIATITTTSASGERSFRACSTVFELECAIASAVRLGLHHDVRHVPLPADDLERLRDLHRGVARPADDREELLERVTQYQRLEARGLVETEYSSVGHPPVARITEAGLRALGYEGEELESELAEQEGR